MEFHIDDEVVHVRTGKSFKVTGIAKPATESLVYCGRNTGWIAEEDLDYDFSPEEKNVLLHLEHDLNTLTVASSNILELKNKLLRHFNMRVPSHFHKLLSEQMMLLQEVLK